MLRGGEKKYKQEKLWMAVPTVKGRSCPDSGSPAENRCEIGSGRACIFPDPRRLKRVSESQRGSYSTFPGESRRWEAVDGGLRLPSHPRLAICFNRSVKMKW